MSFPLGLKLIFLIFSVLLSIAFFTLYERKILSYSQKRKGPNILGLKGILQPFSDAIKLFTKEPIFLNSSNIILMVLSPILSLGLTLTLWLSCPSELGMLEISLGIVFVLCCLSAGVYPTLGAGWSSNSKYSLLGGLRAVAQTISYEVSLAITLLSFIILSTSYSMDSFFLLQGQWFLIMVLPLALIWFVSCLAETNRTPFDFSEGESELVSGFNTEYSGGGFALFFLAEYGSILFMSMFFALVFMGGEGLSLTFALKTTMVAFSFIWVRSTLPRFRYDKLMSLAWKVFLPVTLGYFMFFMGFKLFILIF
uniref:NADH-ubiquinone oxidoreductase chain 1 n=1 Tax=Glyptonotus cf. antarcticus FK-2009 TaxID=692432 RepID=E3SXA3_9CRUS|nr:NADH dehydrogenase subunit 1 [Glyptonotus cf. antarcticus FK-2009]